MSDATSLKCWPGCVFAIDWSHDGIIALASRTRVELLFPNIETVDSDFAFPQWRHFPIRVPWFTKAELPPKDTAHSKIFSVGEEISDSNATALAWSPPGLAKFRRAALAVLTSNLVLQLWTSDGDPQNDLSWGRRLIINDALEDYFTTEEQIESGHFMPDEEEKWRLRRRVRVFAWAPAYPSEKPAGILGTSISWFQQLIAVSNDDNQVVVLAVCSPASGLWTDDVWSSEVLGYFSPSQDREAVDYDSFTFDDLMQEQTYIPHLSWSPWTINEEGLQSILAYATNKDIRVRLVSYNQGGISFGPEAVCPNIETRYSGPMSWSPIVRDGMLTLVIFTTTQLICLTISSSDASIMRRMHHHLDGRWDVISGLAWDTHDPDHTRLHFSTQITTTRYSTAVLEVSPTALQRISDPVLPYWCEQIKGSEIYFSAEHELHGNALAKVWGLCASPLGEYIAYCQTTHPTDAIEYGAQNNRRTAVVLTNLWGNPTDLWLPRKAVTAESIMFAVRKWIEKNLENADELPPLKDQVHRRLIELYRPVYDSSLPSYLAVPYDSTDIKACLSAFKQNTFLDPHILTERYDILSSHICTPDRPTKLSKLKIAHHLIKALQRLPRSLFESDEQSQLILEGHQQILPLIQYRVAHPDIQTDDFPPLPDPLVGDDNCIFCDAQIPFSNLSTACCPNNHSFPRCGLSFIAMQVPRCSKVCGICDTVFFSEEYILADHRAELEKLYPPLSTENGIQASTEGVGVGTTREDTETYSTQFEGYESGDDATPEGSERGVRRPRPRAQTRRVTNGDSESDGSELFIPYEEIPSRQPEDQVFEDAVEAGDGVEGPEPPRVPAHVLLRRRRAPKRMKEVDRVKGLQPTLERVLYLACDVCIYCGGKFIGET